MKLSEKEYIEQIERLLNTNNRSQLRKLINEFISEYPNSEYGYFYKAICTDESNEKESLLKKVLEINSDFAPALNHITEYFFYRAKFQAIIDISNNILKNRTSKTSRFLLGVAYYLLEDYKNASYILFDLISDGYELNESEINSKQILQNLLNPQPIYEILISNYVSIKETLIKNLSNRKEIYFLGENGVGKTVLLQAITDGLKRYSKKREEKVNGDEEEITPAEHIINYSLRKLQSNENLRIHLSSEKTNQTELKVPYPNAFAYGVSRFRESERHVDKTGVKSLFDRDALLIHPIGWLKEVQRIELLEERKKNKTNYLRLKTVIQLLTDVINIEDSPEFEIIEKDNTFKFKERGTELDFEQLADGYRSVLIWLCDLVSHLAENQPLVSNIQDFRGIVLIDEIDMFLHPKWELAIVSKLREKLPKIQWFLTTHSPLLLLGASEDAVFYKVYKNENGETCVSEPYHANDFANRMINGFITSPLFDLPTARPSIFSADEHDLQTGNYYYDLIHDEVKKRLKSIPAPKEAQIKETINQVLNNLQQKGKL